MTVIAVNKTDIFNLINRLTSIYIGEVKKIVFKRILWFYGYIVVLKRILWFHGF